MFKNQSDYEKDGLKLGEKQKGVKFQNRLNTDKIQNQTWAKNFKTTKHGQKTYKNLMKGA